MWPSNGVSCPPRIVGNIKLIDMSLDSQDQAGRAGPAVYRKSDHPMPRSMGQIPPRAGVCSIQEDGRLITTSDRQASVDQCLIGIKAFSEISKEVQGDMGHWLGIR